MAAVIALSAFETYELVCPQGLPPLSDRRRAASRGLVRVGFEINHKAGEEWAALANGKDGQGAEIALSAFETYELVCPQVLPPLSDRSRAASRGLVHVKFDITPKCLTSG